MHATQTRHVVPFTNASYKCRFWHLPAHRLEPVERTFGVDHVLQRALTDAGFLEDTVGKGLQRWHARLTVRLAGYQLRSIPGFEQTVIRLRNVALSDLAHRRSFFDR